MFKHPLCIGFIYHIFRHIFWFSSDLNMLKHILTSSRLPWELSAAAQRGLQAGNLKSPGAKNECLIVS